jgi:hypothetical protein
LFSLHHNGITLSAAKVDLYTDGVTIYNPRLLNGAQTVSTFSEFVDHNHAGLQTVKADDDLQKLKVLCRIIVQASDEAVTAITISNNRQNPVLAWQLHANDLIQLRLEAWFGEDNIPYQRQHRAFAKVSAQDWQEMEFKETKAVELLNLARTFLCVEGQLNKLSHIGAEFESDKDYADLFGPHRLNADRRFVILCYKAWFKRKAFVETIKEKGQTRYYFLNRYQNLIWGLVCQAMLNHSGLEQFAEEYGHDLTVRHRFTNDLCDLASTKVRSLLSGLLEYETYTHLVKEQNYSFLRSTLAFERAMAAAKKQYGWKAIRLR